MVNPCNNSIAVSPSQLLANIQKGISRILCCLCKFTSSSRLKTTIYFKTEFNNPSNYIPHSPRSPSLDTFVGMHHSNQTHFVLRSV